MPEDVRSDQAAAVRWLRERIGLSREHLAAASGVSAVHIKFIERGKRNPSEAVIQKLLPALRVSRRDLDGLLALRPWARSTASGDPATLSTYAAGVPLAVAEGSEFDAAPARPAPAAGGGWPTAGPAPPAQPMAAAGMPASAGHPTRTQSVRLGAYRPSAPAPAAAAPPPSPPPPAPQSPSAPPPPAPQSPSAPATLDAELLELRERYVHLPRSNQEMVLGWLRALDDR